jgi:hypothetical protein
MGVSNAIQVTILPSSHKEQIVRRLDKVIKALEKVDQVIDWSHNELKYIREEVEERGE